MLEKFLKFFRGDSEENETLPGSYLSHLLDEIEPHMREELEECPKHDPLPLLVALTLKKTGDDRFDHDLKCPVVDADSVSLEPPPPPGPSADQLDDTNEAPPPAPMSPPDEEEGEDEAEEEAEVDEETAADDEAQEEESGADEQAEEEAREVDEQDETDDEDGDETEADASEDTDDEADEAELADDGEESDDGDDDAEAEEEASDETDADAEDAEAEEDDEDEEESDASDADDDDDGDDDGESGSDENEVSETDKTNEIEHAESTEEDETDEYGEVQPEGLVDDPHAQELEATNEELDTDVYEMEAAVEAEMNRAAEAGRIHGADTVEDSPLRVDSEIVLEMGRVFLGMLVENDCLPVELQMSPEEIDQARRLLAGYFLGDAGLEQRAREMLRLVEEKFDEGMFSQARILLQLFDADDSTRIENDRNLFYEEMILRFGIQRRHPVGSGIHDKLGERLEAFSDDPGELEELFDWLAETIYVSFDLYGRDSERVGHWRELAEMSERPRAADRLLDVIPSPRWRLLSQFSDSAVDLLDDQLTRDYVADYVTEHVKTCYFVLRAVGDTGLEPYLDVFFDWVDEEFDVDGPGLMPRLYNETTANERLIDEIFDDLYAEHFEEQVEEQREAWTPEQLEKAVGRALGKLSDNDLSEIPPGHYDFGRFVLDELFEIDYPSGEFPYKMHRIT